MILGLLHALNEVNTTNVVKPESITIKHVKYISQGMSKEALLSALGNPSRTEKIHNFYSDEDSIRYYYEDEPCAFTFHSCTVDLQQGKVASYHDVKLTE